MSAHTPGPWRVLSEPDHLSRRTICGTATYTTPDGEVYEGEQGVCLVGFLDTPPEEDDANARLIAAAPDLLEALKKLVDLREMTEPDEFAAYCALFKSEGAEFWNAADAAIAKAEGGQSC